MNENQKQNIDDYNNEMAGRDTGRIKRFLSKEARDYLDDKKEQKSRDKLSLLDILLLTDPVYAQLYSDVMDRIKKIDQAISKALTLTEQRIDNLEANLADIRKRAQRLEDGTLIYRSQNGKVYTEDGVVVSPEKLDDVKWKASDPSWEERRDAGKALKSAHEQKEEIVEYRDTTLQHAKDRMNDKDNLPDKDELQDLFDNLKTALPDTVEANMDESSDNSVESDFMKQFQSKASGQDQTPELTAAQHLPTTQNTEFSQKNPVMVS